MSNKSRISGPEWEAPLAGLALGKAERSGSLCQDQRQSWLKRMKAANTRIARIQMNPDERALFHKQMRRTRMPLKLYGVLGPCADTLTGQQRIQMHWVGILWVRGSRRSITMRSPRNVRRTLDAGSSYAERFPCPPASYRASFTI